MLAQRFRLTGKDVNYIVKRRSVFYTHNFTIFWIPQYPNRRYHQASMHISLKLHKSAVMRRRIKRKLQTYFESLDLITHPLGGKYYKFFIMLNKKKIPELVADMESLGKEKFVDTMQKRFAQEWKYFVKSKLG